MTIVTGPLFLHSETGTEGGWWAMQNEEFITPPAEEPTIKICATCHRYWDTSTTTAEPPPSFTYYRADREEDGTKYLGGYFSSNVQIEGGQTTFGNEEEGSFNDKWTRSGNEASAKCLDNGHVWEWQEPHETWEYEGLVYIQNGDTLEVFDPQNPENVIDTIEVKLLSNGDQYAEDARSARGMVIHKYPDPESIDTETWEEYFFDGYQGRLTRKD